jgi:hypothetical protein
MTLDRRAAALPRADFPSPESVSKAFSSEVEAGSRQENASNQESARGKLREETLEIRARHAGERSCRRRSRRRIG